MPAIKYLNGIEIEGASSIDSGDFDFNQNEALNIVVHTDADPSTNIGTPLEGQLAWDSTDNELQVYNGTSWEGSGETILAGTGLTKTASTINVIANADNSLIANADDVQVNSSIVPFLANAQTFTAAQTIDVASGAALIIDNDTPVDDYITFKDAGVTRGSIDEITGDLRINATGALRITPTGNLTLNPTTGVVNLSSNTLTGPADPTSGTHVGDRDYNDARYATLSHTHVHTDITDFDAGVQTNRLDQMATPTASVALGSQKITGLATPTSDNDAANKLYVDNAVQGLDAKQSVVAATTGNITIATALNAGDTIDGVTLAEDDRVLVKNQTTASQNGIYVVDASPFRANDANTWDEHRSAFVWVEKGTTNSDSGFLCTVDSGGTLDTTDITWVQFSGAGQITAGNGLTKTGNTINVVASTGITVAADSVSIDTTIVPRKNVSNTFTQQQTISYDASAGGAQLVFNNTDTTNPYWTEFQASGVVKGGFLWGNSTDEFIIGADTGVNAKFAGDEVLIDALTGILSLDSATGISIDAGTGDVTFIGSPLLKGISDPSAAQDAATKNYVDTNAPRVYTTTIGNAADTEITVTHNFNTRNVITEVYTTASPYDTVECLVERPTANTCEFTFNSAPASGAYTVVIMGLDG